MLPANCAHIAGISDCADLPRLDEATLLHNLRVRYDNDRIYTYAVRHACLPIAKVFFDTRALRARLWW